MQENNLTTTIDHLPEHFDSLEALGAFWDTHSTADYEEWMESIEMEFEFSPGKTYLAVAQNLLKPLRAVAKQQGVSTETVVNLWLQEKLAELAL